METFPSYEVLKSRMDKAETWERGNTVPFAVIFRRALTPEQCRAIEVDAEAHGSYSIPKCEATTTQFPRDVSLESLDPILELAKAANNFSFCFDLDPEPTTWMQSYLPGGEYQLHADAEPGKMRKLTAVAMLTDELYYEGGKLLLHFHPVSYVVPRDQGTVVVFNSMLFHEVAPILSGFRKTINMGFYGPPFR